MLKKKYDASSQNELSQRISARSVNVAKISESKMAAVHRSLCLMLTTFR